MAEPASPVPLVALLLVIPALLVVPPLLVIPALLAAVPELPPLLVPPLEPRLVVAPLGAPGVVVLVRSLVDD